MNGIRLALTGGYCARVPLCWVRRQDVLAREHLAFVRGMWVGPPDMTEPARPTTTGDQMTGV